MNVFSILNSKKAAEAPPGRRIYAVGDVHGRADLLEALLEKISADCALGGFEGDPILVFVGDYIDRGLQSRAVIDRLLRLADEGYETYFLKGNHEAVLLEFLDRPETGAVWFAIGGAETLFSYGVPAPKPGAAAKEWRFASRALRAAIPAPHMRFLTRLKLTVQLGDYLFVHAGLRPGEPLERQAENDLLEIRAPFLNARRRWPFTVVHGHTPFDEVTRKPGRISIDTGAYATGRLSAVRLQGAEVAVLHT
jgi:serine/threonine protein phosphatase 1